MIFIVSIVLLALPAFASPTKCKSAKSSQAYCEITWENETAPRRLQLVKKENGCEFPEGAKKNCATLLYCEGDRLIDSGVSYLIEGMDLSLYCKTPSPIDLFVSSQAKGPSAFIVCDPKTKKATGLKLVSSLTAVSKNCRLPVWQERE